MSLKDRIEEWYFDDSVRVSPFGETEPLKVTQQELFYIIEHYVSGPVQFKRDGISSCHIDGFYVRFKVLNFNDYYEQIEKRIH